MTLMAGCLAWAGPETSPLPGSDVGTAARSLLAVFIVLGLIALCAWLARRGVLGAVGRKGPSAVRVETAVPLGERRSLAIVSVEGRRLLLGLTPQQVTLVAELERSGAGFAASLDRATVGDGPAAGGRP